MVSSRGGVYLQCWRSANTSFFMALGEGEERGHNSGMLLDSWLYKKGILGEGESGEVRSDKGRNKGFFITLIFP